MGEAKEGRPTDLKVAIALQFIVAFAFLSFWISGPSVMNIFDAEAVRVVGGNIVVDRGMANFYHGTLFMAIVNFLFATGVLLKRQSFRWLGMALSVLTIIVMTVMMAASAQVFGNAGMTLHLTAIPLSIALVFLLRSHSVKQYFHPEQYSYPYSYDDPTLPKPVVKSRIGGKGVLALSFFILGMIFWTSYAFSLVSESEYSLRKTITLKDGSVIVTQDGRIIKDTRTTTTTSPSSSDSQSDMSPVIQQQIRNIEEACGLGHDAFRAQIEADTLTSIVDSFMNNKLTAPYDNVCDQIIEDVKRDSVR